MTLLARLASDLGPEPLSPSPTNPSGAANGVGDGLDPATIAIVIVALLVIAGLVWFVARRRRS